MGSVAFNLKEKKALERSIIKDVPYGGDGLVEKIIKKYGLG